MLNLEETFSKYYTEVGDFESYSTKIVFDEIKLNDGQEIHCDSFRLYEKITMDGGNYTFVFKHRFSFSDVEYAITAYEKYKNNEDYANFLWTNVQINQDLASLRTTINLISYSERNVPTFED